MNEDRIRTRRETLVKERDDLLQQANTRLAYLNGQIALCDELLKPEESQDASSESSEAVLEPASS
jgi:hypothetical protein